MKKLFTVLLVLAGCGPEQTGPVFPVELYVTASPDETLASGLMANMPLGV